MSIDQLLRYSVAFLIDSISNGYTLITIHELKPWVFFAFKDNGHPVTVYLSQILSPVWVTRLDVEVNVKICDFNKINAFQNL